MRRFVYKCPVCGAKSYFYVHEDGWDSEWGCECLQSDPFRANMDELDEVEGEVEVNVNRGE